MSKKEGEEIKIKELVKQERQLPVKGEVIKYLSGYFICACIMSTTSVK